MKTSRLIELVPAPLSQKKIHQNLALGIILAIGAYLIPKMPIFAGLSGTYFLIFLALALIGWISYPVYAQIINDAREKLFSPLSAQALAVAVFFFLAIRLFWEEPNLSLSSAPVFIQAIAVLTVVALAKLAFANFLFVKIFQPALDKKSQKYLSGWLQGVACKPSLWQKRDRAVVNGLGVLILALVGAYLIAGIIDASQWLNLLPLIEAVIIVVFGRSLILLPLASLIHGSITGFKNKLWFRNLDLFEKILNLKFIILEKSRVITAGKVKVWKVVASNPRQALSIALTLSQKSAHPYSRAICEQAKQKGVRALDAAALYSYPGQGLVGKIDNKTYILGNEKLMHEFNVVIGMIQREKIRLEKQGLSVVVLAEAGERALGSSRKRHPGEIIALVAFSDPPKQKVPKIITWLESSGFATYLLTSDSFRTARALAKQVGISDKRVLAEAQTPYHPRQIRLLKEELKSPLMVVIGSRRDEPALESADIGVFLSDKRRFHKKADVTILGKSLTLLAGAIALSEITFTRTKRIRLLVVAFNFAGALVAGAGLLAPIPSVAVVILAHFLIGLGIFLDKKFARLAKPSKKPS